ncbi:MAG: glycoside hydrolase family 9 protein [Pseudomonadota bacterium]
MKMDPTTYTDIMAFGNHHGTSSHTHGDDLEGGRIPITTEAMVAYNGLRAFLGLEATDLKTIGQWAFHNEMTNNSTPSGDDLSGVGLYYGMQGAKVGWIRDDAFAPQILVDIQRAARLSDPADVMTMVQEYGYTGFADYLETHNLTDAFINTLKMEPHYGGWMHGRTHGSLSFDGVANAHDVNHLTVLSHDQTQPFMNDTFDYPQWAALDVSHSDVINYFQSMVTLDNPRGEGIPSSGVTAAPIAPPADLVDPFTPAAPDDGHNHSDHDHSDHDHGDMGGSDMDNGGASQAASDVSANTQIGTDAWNGGSVSRFTIDVNEAQNGWQVSFELDADITNIWNARIVSQTGSTYVVENMGYNANIPANGQIAFGFQASGVNSTIDPSTVSVNGESIESSAASTPEPQTETETDSTPEPEINPDNPPSDNSGNSLSPFGASSYSEALNKSMEFYYAQYAGDLPEDHPVEWRNDSVLNDGADVGRDLSGGMFDAGDHVKFGFPMANTATTLAWGGLEFSEGYRQSGADQALTEHLRHLADYFLNAYEDKGTADISDDVFHAQVGDGHQDHSFWGAPEDIPHNRPTFSVDADNPGSDVAGETAAALAATSMYFRNLGDTEYANQLLEKAISLFDFAETYQGKYSDAIPNAQSFYNSWSGYEDELAWSANWLYQATGDVTYLEKSEQYYNSADTSWAYAWDDKGHGTAALLAEQTGDSRYINDIENHLEYWLNDISRTPGTDTNDGLAWLDQWGSNRYAANTSFIASVYANTLEENGGNVSITAEELRGFAEDQIDYMLGDNPEDFSYMVGFGEDYSQQPHHRAASGTNNISDPGSNQYILTGALVGGPDKQGNYNDARTDYIFNEVATDYNAGFSGALAATFENMILSSATIEDEELELLMDIEGSTADSSNTSESMTDVQTAAAIDLTQDTTVTTILSEWSYT